MTTRGNLSSDQSGGLELVLSANLGGIFTANWSGSAFLEQIDATNLGFSDKKSTTSWSSILTVSTNLNGTSRVQVNGRYNSTRLTPQGDFSPSYVINTGLRQDFLEGRPSLILTGSDIFRTLKREPTLNTSALDRDVLNTRDAQIFFIGFTYHFGVEHRKRMRSS